MKLLIDAATLAPQPPSEAEGRHSTGEALLSLSRLGMRNGHVICMLPGLMHALRSHPSCCTTKPLTLPKALSAALPLSMSFTAKLHLWALSAEICDLLVTESPSLHNGAQSLDLSHRCLCIHEATRCLHDLAGTRPILQPQIHTIAIEEKDRDDLLAGITGDNRVPTMRKKAPGGSLRFWSAGSPAQNAAAWCLQEMDPVSPEICKVSHFTIADHCDGHCFAEDLLQRLLQDARESNYTTIRIETDPHQLLLHRLLFRLGFTSQSHPHAVCFSNSLSGTDQSTEPFWNPAPHFLSTPHPVHIIPLSGGETDRLFPETDCAPSLFPVACAGSAIRKRLLATTGGVIPKPGSTLLFYRTTKQEGIVAIGIAEKAMKEKDPNAIARFFSDRSPMPMKEICSITASGRPVLALRFRLSAVLPHPIPKSVLQHAGFFHRPPHAIKTAHQAAVTWMQHYMEAALQKKPTKKTKPSIPVMPEWRA